LSYLLQEPGLLTTFGRSDCHNFISLDIKDLTQATYGQFIPAKSGQGHWLFQIANEIKNLLSAYRFNWEEKIMGVKIFSASSVNNKVKLFFIQFRGKALRKTCIF
jgi:hypothetical protein